MLAFLSAFTLFFLPFHCGERKENGDLIHRVDNAICWHIVLMFRFVCYVLKFKVSTFSQSYKDKSEMKVVLYSRIYSLEFVLNSNLCFILQPTSLGITWLKMERNC